MKKLYYIPFLFLLFVLNIQAQTIQASLGIGTLSNSVKIYIKSPIAIASTNISTLQFNIGIPSSITQVPTVTVRSSSISGVTWGVESAVIEGGYINYAIQTPNYPLVFSLAANTDFEVMELVFAGGPINTPQMVSLVTLPDGGLGLTNGKALFFSSGYPVSVGNNLYYNRAGVAVNNLFSYDAINGISGTGTSTATMGGVVLPTKFLSFYATKSDDVAKLTWTVDNEENNNYFEVEGSTDGRNFTMLQKVNSLHNGRTSNTYNTVDNTISRYNAKVLYYRIKQVEADGRVIYSEIRQISLTGKDFSAALYPNPVKTNTNLVIDAPVAMKAIVIIRDAAGKSVKQMTIELAKGINQQTIDAAFFAAGDYNVTIISDKLNQTIKMTKSN